MKQNRRILMALLMAFALLLTACGGSAGQSMPPDAGGAGIDYAEDAPAAAEEYRSSFDDAYYEMADVDGSEGNRTGGDLSGESYLTIDEHRQQAVSEESTLTLSLKVDTAAYTNVARYIESGNLPPADSVRTEELLNYFRYESEMPDPQGPFSIYTEVGPSPFDREKSVAFVRITTRELDKSQLPPSSLTFLIDTSGSMYSYDKLPLLKEAFGLLVETLDEDDTVSIVTYAGNSRVVLDGVSGGDKQRIFSAIEGLEAGGSTAGANGIVTAYALAEKNFRAGGNNRILLATDGDFNVGLSSLDALEELVAEQRDSGVYLSILGFGAGNIRDDIMETLSAHGNGNYSYINSVSTARKVLVEELGTSLFTVADDVKAQVVFHPATVKGYRLIGYENRRLSNQEFSDDAKDAGEMGAGADVVMMFELEPATPEAANRMKYGALSVQSGSEEDSRLFDVRIRYKNPGETESRLLEQPVTFSGIRGDGVSSDFGFACSVAAFGHLLRGSPYTGDVTLEDVISLARDNLGGDPGGYRLEYLMTLVQYRDLI